MQIEQIKIDKLIPYARNARTHSESQIAQIAAAIKEFGFTSPVLIRDDYTIIAGHGRLKGAMQLGLTEVPCIRLSHLTPTQAKAYGIVDNQLTLNSEWEPDLLKLELEDLNLEDFDLSLLGFDDLNKLMPDTEKQAIEDDVPEVPKETFVKLGDMFQLGDHRLFCGDCTVKENVERLMNGEKADMVFTDPPYGIDLNTEYSNLSKSEHGYSSSRNKNNFNKIMGDDKPFNAESILKIFSNINEIFLWGANYYHKTLNDNGSWIVWDKRQTEDLDKMFGSQFELCWSKTKHRHEIARVTWSSFFGHNKKDDGDKKIHPSQKPVKLAEWFLERFAVNNKIICDPFCGSGFVLIACEKTGRKCFGMEIDPHYCQVILERWAKYSNKQWIKI
jgi:DNA modification methylase